jgi:hypothetical protein
MRCRIITVLDVAESVINSSRIKALRPRALFAAALLPLATCGTNPTDAGQPLGPSVAYGAWTPGPNDTCTVEEHNYYSTVGPDGLWYPTWHPPTDPVTKCSFGHEHGSNPRGSALYQEVGALAFGYANQQLGIHAGMRLHEDHAGHKVERENDVELTFGGGKDVVRVRCDVLTKRHYGTHSPHADTNIPHEIIYHARCTNGTRMSVTMLTAMGSAGEFDARSTFDSIMRSVDVNASNIPDANGRKFWHTDPFGRNARKEPFPGSIRQYIARIDNGTR